MASRPLTQADRDQVAELHAQGLGRNAIAQRIGRSASTVTKIATEAGLSFDRAATAAATEAAKVDNAARREALAFRFLDEANSLLDELHQPHVVFAFGGRDNTYAEHTLPEPTARDKQALVTAAAIAFDKHLKQQTHDSDTHGLAAVDEWLRGMVGG